METLQLVMQTLDLVDAGTSKRRSRRFVRSKLIKAAQIGFGGTVIDCVLLDISIGGAQVQLLRQAYVPGLATLRFQDGASRTALRRWQNGEKVGFEFVNPMPEAEVMALVGTKGVTAAADPEEDHDADPSPQPDGTTT